MKTSRSGIELIKKWEGCRLTAYKCSANVLTIGYGHTSAAGAPKVTAGMKITQQDADDILVRDLVQYEAAVQKALTRSANQNQFDAMVSLAFNIGGGAFAKSALVKKFNSGDLIGAADAFLSWRKAGGKVVQGLVKRRQEERLLFLKPYAIPSTPKTEPAATPVSPPADATGPSLWDRVIAWWSNLWKA